MVAPVDDAEPIERDDTARWLRHAGGAVLGIAFALAVQGAQLLERELRAQVLLTARPGWMWVTIAMYLALGALVIGVVLVAPRLPWAPTSAAALLVYGVAESSFSALADALPRLGPWQPSLDWGLAIVSLAAGAMTATAVWGWWAYRGGRRATHT